MADVLIIDDDQFFSDVLARGVARAGHYIEVANTLKDGARKASSHSFDVIYLDVNLPDGSGLDMIADLKRQPGEPEVIIITGRGDESGAELAMRVGAWDYLQKPASIKAMILPLVRALQYREARSSRVETPPVERWGIMGSSPPLTTALNRMAQASRSDSAVLITGETGTGKELFARAIHKNSPRASGKMVVVDCASLPENLVASVLFGHQRGAFTGADRSTPGMILEAHQGTLFLDEVGELPMELQKAFLRVLQERRFRPVGGSREVTSDFRLLAATNRDLEAMVSAGQFRPELLYRLRSLTIDIAPLRERTEDIVPLALAHLADLASRSGVPTKGLSPEFLEALTDYPWPGNVRELFHALERAVAESTDSAVLHPAHLPTDIRVDLAQRSLHSDDDPTAFPMSGGRVITTASPPVPWDHAPALPNLPTWRDFREQTLAEAGKEYLTQVMEACEGNMSDAQKVSGLSRARLYALIKEYGLPRRHWTRQGN